MRTLLLVPVLLALASPTPCAQSTDGVSAEAPGEAPTGARDGRLMSPLETARRLAKAWPLAVYQIKRGKRDFGVYVQRNTMSEVDGKRTIEFFDTIQYPKINQNYLLQTMCGTEQHFDVLGLAGKMAVGQMKVQHEGGRLRGMQFGQTPVDIEVPDFFVTDLTLLRKPHGVLLRRGDRHEFAHLKVEAMPNEGCVRTGTLTCDGLRKLKLDGQEFDAWKFTWQVDEEKPFSLWYGPEGQLLKREFGKETWTYSPERTKRALEKDEGAAVLKDRAAKQAPKR